MLLRFSLYGFFKNQRYFEPFLILFFLDKGLSFTQIGVLVAFRELFRNIIEVPSGSFADLYGRRFSILISFSSYIISFLIFGFGQNYIHFFAAMFFFAIGDAFRTGTHKAIIFTWLRQQNRIDEKTKIYGFTRSWSKIGSALSIVIATMIMLFKEEYDDLFLYASVPYVFGLINILSYPKYLDGDKKAGFNLGEIFSHFYAAVKKSIALKPLRRLLSETMSYEGIFTAVKDYIQPLLFNLALVVPIFISLQEKSRSAILIGIVYFILYLASAFASRKSHKLVKVFKNEEKGTKFIWGITLLTYLLLIPLLYFEIYLPAVILFVVLFLLQNFWRPMQISRFDNFATEEEGATVLSIESQAKSFVTMLIAPLFGFLVDLTLNNNLGCEFWMIAFVGTVISIFFYFRKQ